jgi:hypothetical protein
VPAAMIIEDKENCGEEHLIIQKEARYRLRNMKGIRVFSRPGLLKDWLKKEGIDFESVKHLITDAGQIVPGFTVEEKGVEFFVHSPFAKRLNECEVIDRNSDSIVLQVRFVCDKVDTRFILSADAPHEVLSDMVEVTRIHKREERLIWDIFKLPHHCSYLSLGPDKGKDKTEPVPNVKWLFEKQGQKGGIIVSTSWDIPYEDTDQPPHRQAANYYRGVVSSIQGEFIVTMEHPTKSSPKPLVILIDKYGAKVQKQSLSGSAFIVSTVPPRSGASHE